MSAADHPRAAARDAVAPPLGAVAARGALRLADLAQACPGDDLGDLLAVEAAVAVGAEAAGIEAWDGWFERGRHGRVGSAGRAVLRACREVRRGRSVARLAADAGDRVVVAVAIPGRLASRGALWALLPRPPEDPDGSVAALGRIAALVGALTGGARPVRPAGEAAGPTDRPGRGSEATLELVIAAAQRSLGAERASCCVFDGAGGVAAVHTTDADPVSGPQVRTAIARHGAALAEALGGRPEGATVRLLTADDREFPPAATVVRETGAGAVAVLRLDHPSRRRGDGSPTPLGVLGVALRPGATLGEWQRAMLRALGEVAIGALTAVDSTGRGGEDAEGARDGLTGLPSHRAFHERLRVAAARAAGGPLALVLLDIDRFRRINEEHGHLAGDRVLQEVARRTCAAAGPQDVVARVGGEEIAWLMHASAMASLQAAERVREAIAATPIAEVGTVTVSAGVCDLARAGGSAARMVRQAEGALYWAKQHGRNVACLYSSDEVEVLSAHEQAERLARSQALQSIRVLARAVDAKDPSTRRHSERVADLAVALARAQGWSESQLVLLREAGLVHDVGKIGVPDVILAKPGRLTAAEHHTITAHAALGAEIVADVLTADQVAWVRGHHERWDGGGYPDGLAAEAIPDGARVLAVADAWDVMTSERPYRQSMAVDEAVAECLRCRGGQFAPDVVDTLIGLAESGGLVGALPVVRGPQPAGR